MITKALTYRSIKLFVLISTFLLILSSCDIIDSIFGSGDEDVNGTVGPGYGLIGTQVIGSTGGEINLDSIIVNIPSGAFDENTELSIYVGDDNDGFDEYGISSLYQIKGLPGKINKPVKLSIKYHGTLEGDTLVAIGEMQHSTSIDSSLYSYQTENASDSSGYLVYDLPAYSSLAKLVQSEYDISTDITKVIIAVNAYKRALSSKGNFRLHYPLFYEQQAIAMGEHFETAYDKCLAMGFGYSARTAWPINVLAKNEPDTYGFYSFKNSEPNGKKTVTDAELISFINHGQFTIDTGSLSNDLVLRVTCGHEFLHLVQNMYEFSSPNIELEQDWLSEATSVWIEEKYANVVNYVSSNHEPIYPFLGWQYSDSNISHADFGYGLSPIIKDIADRYGESEIIKIFEEIKKGILPSGAVDPVEAIKTVVEKWEPLATFWHGVLSSYVLGVYYNSQVNFKFLDEPNNYLKTFTIDGSYTTDSFSNNYMDLSGRFVIVKPGDISSLNTVPLSFTIDDPTNCGILVCQYKQGSEITKLGEVYPGKNGQVLLGDAKPIFDAGYELVVLVSNGSHDKSQNYQGTNTAELTIELETPPEDLNSLLISSTLGYVSFIMAAYCESEGDSETDVWDDRFDWDYCSYCPVVSEEFLQDGDSFSSTAIMGGSGPIFDECRLDLTFNSDRTEITYINGYKYYIDPTYSNTLTQEMEYYFTINEPIPITTTDLNVINDNGFIEYDIKAGVGAVFELNAKEDIYPDGDPASTYVWTYKDTKGSQRYLKINIQFNLTY